MFKPLLQAFTLNYALKNLKAAPKLFAVDLSWGVPEKMLRRAATEIWYGSSRDLATAKTQLEAAYAKLPDAEIGAHLGEVLWQMGQPDAARAVWRKALGSEPDNSALQETLKRLRVQP